MPVPVRCCRDHFLRKIDPEDFAAEGCNARREASGSATHLEYALGPGSFQMTEQERVIPGVVRPVWLGHPGNPVEIGSDLCQAIYRPPVSHFLNLGERSVLTITSR